MSKFNYLSTQPKTVTIYNNTEIDRWFVGDVASAMYYITVEFDSNQKETLQVLVIARPEQASYTIYGRTSIEHELIDIDASVTTSWLSLTASPKDPSYASAKLTYSVSYTRTINPLGIPTSIAPVPPADGSNITTNPLRSDTGFSSPGFVVDQNGNINFSGSLLNNGVTLISSTTLSSNVTYSSLTSLGTLTELDVAGNVSISGGLLEVATTGSVSLNPASKGAINNVTIGLNSPVEGKFSSIVVTDTILYGSQNVLVGNPTTTGAIDNYNIGSIVRGSGSFTTLSVNNTVTLNPSVGGHIDNVTIGLTTPVTGRFTTVTLIQDPTETNQATSKQYVDTRISALAIALGS